MVGIYRFWMIEKASGLCLIDAEFEDNKTDEKLDGNLISGLLTSYFTFTQKVMGENIRQFETHTRRIIFSIDENYYFAIMMDSKYPTKGVELMLEKVRTSFNQKYKPLIAQGFTGDITIFEEFKEILENAMELKGIRLLKYMRNRKKEFEQEQKLKSLHDAISDY